MLRAHDVLLQDGSFRLQLTPQERVVTVFDLQSSPLGPLHIPVSVDRRLWLPPGVPPELLRQPSVLQRQPDLQRAVRDASVQAFEAMRGVSREIAPPALRITRDAASEAAERIVRMQRHLSPEHDHAARLMARAHLGDAHSRGLLHRILRDARAGVRAAGHAAKALLEVPKFAAKAIDVPVLVASHIKGAGGIVRMLSPLEHFEHMISAVQRGDLKDLERMAKTDLSMMQGVISLIPGIGTGFSSAIAAGLASLEGGHPLAIAIKMAYGAIPIPVGIRQITDVVLDAVIAIIEHPRNLTDVAIQVARDRVPSGFPRQVFDTLVHVVIKHVPIKKEAGALATHYVNRYAGALAGPAITGVVKAIGVRLPLVPNPLPSAAAMARTAR